MGSCATLSKLHKVNYSARFRSLIKAKSDSAKCILYAPALVVAPFLWKILEILAQSAFCYGVGGY
jgi:hypothetical protein